MNADERWPSRLGTDCPRRDVGTCLVGKDSSKMRFLARPAAGQADLCSAFSAKQQL